ncbi:hypothetical protein GpartN1_g1576.t1 [Galdieria partita]|uniref:Uncharacterized protein n=1 Tax=Galdieria partita TaxID=83374 RepID=A0A9C7PSN7_9RHOD|nr:hypothetical protein GpartN1_g1576.t1 [Galdieria partita]
MFQTYYRREKKHTMSEKFDQKEKTESLLLRKALKTAIKLLRLKTIRKLQRLSEASSLRREFVDKLEALRKLKVDSILRAVEDRNLIGKSFSNFEFESVCWEILQDKRVQEALSQVSNRRQKDKRTKSGSYKSSKTHKELQAVEQPLTKSVFVDSLNGEARLASRKRHTLRKQLSNDLSFFESIDLHPSWKAKRWRRNWESSIRFQGSHQYLDE